MTLNGSLHRETTREILCILVFVFRTKTFDNCKLYTNVVHEFRRTISGQIVYKFRDRLLPIVFVAEKSSPFVESDRQNLGTEKLGFFNGITDESNSEQSVILSD